MRPVFLLTGSLFIGIAVGGAMYLLTKEDEAPRPRRARERPVTQPAAKAPTLTSSATALQGLAAVEARLLRNPKRRQLAALALLYAAEGRDADLLRMLDRALEAGVDPDRVLDAIRELPTTRQGAVLAAILERHPDVDFDGFRAARIFNDAGDLARAADVVRKTLPEQDGFDEDLTRFLLHLDPQGASDFLYSMESAKDWRGGDLQALLGFFIEAEQEGAARAFIERAIEASPGDRDTIRVLEQIDPGAAIERLRALVADQPNDVDAWSHLGRMLRRQGRAGAAFEAFERATKLDPSRRTYEALLRADPQRALPLIVQWTEGAKDDEAIGLLARAYMKAGRTRDAVEVFQRAHESDPDDSEWIRGLIRTDPQQAIKSLEAQMARAPEATNEDLVGSYADALRAAGRSAESFDQYVRAHRENPEDQTWQVAMAQVDPERALPILEAFLREDPDDASGQGAYGVALARTGRTTEAVPQLERAIRYGDADKWYRELATIDPERAISALERRARHDRDDETWGTLGKALRELGRDEEARTAFRRALSLDPTDADWAEALRR